MWRAKLHEHKTRVSMLCDQMRLSPYQSYVLQNNAKRYDLARLTRRGGVLYAPYAYDDHGNVHEFCSRMLRGPRADLIGLDRMLICGQRGVKVYASGVFSAYDHGIKYYADSEGHVISKELFLRIV